MRAFDCPLVTNGSDGERRCELILKNTAQWIERQGGSVAPCSSTLSLNDRSYSGGSEEVSGLSSVTENWPTMCGAGLLWRELAIAFVTCWMISVRWCDSAVARACSGSSAVARPPAITRSRQFRCVSKRSKHLIQTVASCCTNQVDALGMKRAGLDWRINDEDRHNLYQTAMAAGQRGRGRRIWAHARGHGAIG